MYNYLGFFSGEIINFLDLYLSSLLRFQDRVNDFRRRCSVWHLTDDQCPVVIRLADVRTDLDNAATLPVIVTADVHFAAGGEVWVQGEFFPAQIGERGIAQFNKVVGQNLRIQTDSNTFHTLRQQQRELDRQVYGFLLPAVVGSHPVRCLGVEDRLKCEL